MTELDNLTQHLRLIIADASGLDQDEIGNDEEFVELGFDSLFLTQLANLLANEFQVELAFKQLVNEFPSIDALASFLAGTVDISRFAASAETDAEQPEPQTTPMEPVANLPLDVPSIPLDEVSLDARAAVFAQQLQLMEAQLQLLSASRVTTTGSKTVSQQPLEQPVATVQPVATPRDEDADADGEGEVAQLPEGFGPTVSPVTEQDETLSAHIDNLIAAYCAKTAGSKRAADQHRGHHADPRTAAGFNARWKELVYPLVVEKSEGARLWDVDGNEYIDLLNGFGPNFFGHRAPFVVEALESQLAKGFEIGPQTPLAGEVAQLICELTGHDRATLVNTGSEAVQAAMRVARTVSGKDLIVVFDGDYHGNFDEVLVRGGKRRTLPLAPGIPNPSVANVLVLPMGDAEALATIRERADEIAGVLIEPVQSRRPQHRPVEFVQGLREVTAANDIALIFDEVITGFRAGFKGAQGYYGVQADLATYGKVVAGGMPIGVVAGSRRYMDTFDGGAWQYGDDSSPDAGVTFFAGTFVRHPLAVAAAHASLSWLKNQGERVYTEVNARTTWLVNALNSLFQRYRVSVSVHHFASQMYFDLSTIDEAARLLFYHVRLRGIYIQEGFPSYLSLAHTDADIEQVIAVFHDSLRALAADHVIDAPVGEDGREFPLTNDQQDIWIASQVDEAVHCAYNESDSLWLRGAIDVQQLVRAIGIVETRHQALHLGVDDVGETQRVVDSANQAKPTMMDFTDLSEDARETALQTFYKEQSTTPFDLASGPLHRIFLIRHTDQLTQLVVYAHHFVYDGWSANVFAEETAELYNALAEHREAALDPPMSYGDFAAKHLACQQQNNTTDIAYWEQALAGLEPRPAFPISNEMSRSVSRNFAGTTAHRSVDAPVADRLETLAKAQKMTMHALVLGAYKLLLSSVNNHRQDIVVGVPRAAQADMSGNSVLGMGVKLLPVRTQVDPEQTVSTFLRTVRDGALESQSHGLHGYSDLLREPAFQHFIGQRDVLDAVYNYSSYFSNLKFGDACLEVTENPRQTTNFPSFCHITRVPTGINIDFDFDRELFDADRVEGWLDILVDLLSTLPDSAEQPVGELLAQVAPVKTEAIAQVQAASISPAPSVLETVLAHCRTQPDKTAVHFAGEGFTYAWLDEKSAKLASALVEAGVPAGGVVAVQMNRGAAMIAAMLGVLRAGAAYLPIDNSYPKQRTAYVLEHSQAQLVLVDEHTEQPEQVSCLHWDSGSKPMNAVVDGPHPYIIYTSGSSGTPKGVWIGQAAFNNYVHAVSNQPGIDQDDVVLAQTTISFDIHVTEIWGALYAGASIVVADEEQCLDGFALKALVEEHRVSVIQATPSTWRLLKDASWEGGGDVTGMIGGEAVPIDLVDYFCDRLASFWNMYGPTEATVWATCARLTKTGQTPSIGNPLPGLQVHVLDDQLQPVPDGQTGELFISGVALAEGYHRDLDLTDQHFLEVALPGGQSERMYRTGDLVFRNDAGELVFHSRKDNQVKIRGFRIELGEIEAAMFATGWVSEAVALLESKTATDVRLLVCYVASADSNISHTDLRKALSDRLPHYMVPQQFVELPNIPKTDNGKVDRKRLLEEMVPSQPAPERVAPESETEQLIAELWSELLGIDDIDRFDHFFDIGGHSLLTMQFIAKLQKASGVKLKVKNVVFEDLSSLALLVDAGKKKEGGWLNRLLG